MGSVPGDSAIEESLSGLERRYGSFPVNQTTVSLPHERFERAAETHDPFVVDAYAEVRNGNRDVLHVEDDGAMELPGCAVDVREHIETQVCDAVEQATGAECVVEGIESATIAGLRDEDIPEADTLYHLVVVFEAEYQDGTLAKDADWQQERERLGTLYA